VTRQVGFSCSIKSWALGLFPCRHRPRRIDAQRKATYCLFEKTNEEAGL
jgi:hypothetical protein